MNSLALAEAGVIAPVDACERCGERIEGGASVECFEMLGEVVCHDCASDALMDDGQPDEQQEWTDYDPDC